MGDPPGAYPRDVFRSLEVVATARLGEPTLLAGGLARTRNRALGDRGVAKVTGLKVAGISIPRATLANAERALHPSPE